MTSESEWEYACRGTGHPAGTTTQYFWGDEMDDSYCWYGENSGKKTHAVTEHMNKANAFGLVDMSGNVWEWCQDKRINNYNNGPRDSLPRTSDSSYRVYRGGGWASVLLPTVRCKLSRGKSWRSCKKPDAWFCLSPAYRSLSRARQHH